MDNRTVFHYHSLDDLTLKDAWLAIGIFDGVHRGHQQILRPLVSGALATSATSVILTFDPHPAVVLGGKTDFKSLTTPDERASLLVSYGIQVVITQTFDRAFANQTAAEFMSRLSKTLGLQHLMIGYDTALGRGREGDARRLTEIGKTLGYTVEVVPPLNDESGVISSTRIRAAIQPGTCQALRQTWGAAIPLAVRSSMEMGADARLTSRLQIFDPAGKSTPRFWHLCLPGLGGWNKLRGCHQHRCSPDLLYR